MPDIPETSTNASIPPDDVMRLAVNVAKRNRWAVFPVREDKTPRLKEWDKRASCDPDEIAAMWRQCPDPLIGVATGAVSGVWVLDVDVKHPEAIDWWHLAHPRLLPTRAYRTRSGGIHCYYTGADGLRNSASRPVRGIDVRGDGGYVVFWFTAGFECLDPSPPAPWPAWLRQALARPVATVAAVAGQRATGTGGAISGILDALERAKEGERNALLFWSACRLIERGMGIREVERLLLPTAASLGLDDLETRRTISSAQRGAGGQRT